MKNYVEGFSARRLEININMKIIQKIQEAKKKGVKEAYLLEARFLMGMSPFDKKDVKQKSNRVDD